MAHWRMRPYSSPLIAMWAMVIFLVQLSTTLQEIKTVSVRERKLLANFSVGPQEHSLGFSLHRIGKAQVPIGPRLRFITPDRHFLWISDIVKRRLVLMSMRGELLKAIHATNGYLPWDLYGTMDADGSFYFWDKVINTITKVTTAGTVEEIRLNWDGAAKLLGQPIKRNEYEYRPKCQLDERGNIYVWVVSSVEFSGDDVVGRTGALIKFSPFGKPEKVLLKGDIDFFVDRKGRIYVTKRSDSKIIASVYDNSGQLIQSFTLKPPRAEHASLGVRGEYIVLTFEDGTKFFYDVLTLKIRAQSPNVWQLLGIRHLFEGNVWRSWTIDYKDASLIYLWSASKEVATLEAITLEF